MKSLLLCVLVLLAQIAGADWNITHFLLAAGKKTDFEGSFYYRVEIPKAIVSQINAGRVLQNRPIKNVDEVNSKPWVNKDYFNDWLYITKTQLAKEIGKEPTEDQVLACWLIGIKEFRKINYLPEKIANENASMRMLVFQSFEKSGPVLPPLIVQRLDD